MPIIGEFECSNEEKLNRAIHGSMGRNGRLEGGVGEGASDAVKLAEYDRLGGLIKKGNMKVETGSFYDFAKQTPREKPVIVFAFRSEDEGQISVPEGSDLPLDARPDVGKVPKKKKKKE